MSNTNIKRFSGLAASAILLAGSSAAAIVTPAMANDSTDNLSLAAAAEQTSSDLTAATTENVKGTFSFSQDAVTSNEEIRSVFSKAAAAPFAHPSHPITARL